MSGDTSNGIGPEWREVAVEAGRILQIARFIAGKNAGGEPTEAALLPSLIFAVALSRATSQVCDEIGSGLNRIEESIKDIERPNFDEIEGFLRDIARAISSK